MWALLGLCLAFVGLIAYRWGTGAFDPLTDTVLLCAAAWTFTLSVSSARLRRRMMPATPYFTSVMVLGCLFVLQAGGDPLSERHTNTLLGAYLSLPLAYTMFFLLRPPREALWGSAVTAAIAVALQAALPPVVGFRATTGGWVATLTLLFHGALILLYFSVLRLRSDATEQKRVAAKAMALANTDPLTGLPNRRGLEEVVTGSQAANSAGQQTLLLGFLDFDDFKAVNDSFGHLVGDELLKAVALRLKAAVRAGDLVARLGGDEIVILARQPVPSTRSFFERVLGAFDQPFSVAGEEFLVGASIGVFEGLADLETALSAADAAMYRAKERGGGLEIVDGRTAND